MRNNKKVFLILAVAVGLLMVFRYGCFQASLAYDAYSRPWAYGAEPLLVGVWSGELRDPDGTNWKIRLEIFEPTTSEERWRRIDRPRKKRSRTERTFMDGIAVLESGSRRDTLEIWGGLDEVSAPTKLHFQTKTLNDVYPLGFQLGNADGQWTGTELRLSCGFIFHRADGSGYYDSEDPRFEYRAECMLKQ